ncbi:MAG: DNA polymerase III subunit alpha [Clostridia bacterium]|nr:DNA polymerase III subunit alpha [Clostridia bacterium]
MSGFTHLHLHTEYSLLDGACRLDNVLDRAIELGQTSIAITDHGVMYGAVDFYKKAKAKGIKPIIGCECYVASRTRFDKIHALDSERYHLVLLCKNATGYQNLIAMVSKAWTEGFYTKPRIDKELLEKHSEGLIALSACLAGEIPRALTAGNYEKAKETALWYNSVFGEGNFYLEMQNHGISEQKQIEPLLIKLSNETGIPLVATNDTHYVNREDSKTQQVLICVATNTTIGQENSLEFQTDEFYLKSEEEMTELFSHVPQAIENTQKIADMCNFDFEFGNTKLPHFEVPDGKDHFEWFKEQCYEGMIRNYGENPPQEYYERLDYELDVINKMGYVDYFLIVHDFIRYAKNKGIPVGPGRGSGAGSLAAYCIGITGIDPMKYSLLFERFLNPERVSMPDFDVDFCYERREEVIDYVINKYGADHVAQIVTFGTLAARAAIRDVGRAMGIPYNVVDNVSKQVPRELNITIQKALKKSPEFKELYESDDQIKELIDTSMKVEGMPRHSSTHAAGVVITRDPVASYVPLALNDNSPVTQYTMTTLEELGLLKMDFLGLRTLTVISDAEKMIRLKNKDFDIYKVSTSDEETFKMMSKGQTEGVFQFESAGMKSVLVGLKPVNIEDLIAVISLYRPGPMDSIDTYINNRHHPEDTVYKTEKLRDILEVTNGCMVYQEQVMQIFRSLAGYSYGRADIVRRAMSKKKHDVMEKERQNFIYGMIREDGTVECEGCVKRGIPAEVANDIFDDMSSFASYAFNKSHAAAYAYVSYQTAYLKCHYPCEFMAALLSSVLDNSAKVSEYTNECNNLGIKVLPPHVNESLEGFTVSDGNIRFGLLAIKNLGRNFIKNIIAERRLGKFTSFYDFCSRMHGADFNKRAVESLIRCGALDGLGANRRQMLMGMNEIIDELDNKKKRNVEGQLGLFDMGGDLSNHGEPELRYYDEFPLYELLSMEKETTGLYLSGHPMSEYTDVAAKLHCAKVSELNTSDSDNATYKDGERVKAMGIITHVKKKVTKSDTTMAFVDLEDITGSIEVIVFPKTLIQNSPLIAEGNVVVIKGRLDVRDDEPPKLICEFISTPENAQKEQAQPVKPAEATQEQSAKKKRIGLFLRFPSEGCPEQLQAEKLLAIFEGRTPLYYYFADKKEYRNMPFERFVDVNEPLLDELKKVLGEENVVMR